MGATFIKIKDSFFDEYFEKYKLFQEWVKNYQTPLEYKNDKTMNEVHDRVKKGLCKYPELMHSFFGIPYEQLKMYCEKNKIEYNEIHDYDKLFEISSSFMFFIFSEFKQELKNNQ